MAELSSSENEANSSADREGIPTKEGVRTHQRPRRHQQRPRDQRLDESRPRQPQHACPLHRHAAPTDTDVDPTGTDSRTAPREVRNAIDGAVPPRCVHRAAHETRRIQAPLYPPCLASSMTSAASSTARGFSACFSTFARFASNFLAHRRMEDQSGASFSSTSYMHRFSIAERTCLSAPIEQ